MLLLLTGELRKTSLIPDKSNDNEYDLKLSNKKSIRFQGGASFLYFKFKLKINKFEWAYPDFEFSPGS